MSFLLTFIKRWRNKYAKQRFYEDSTVLKVEWWLNECNRYPDLYWARLRVFANGKAEVRLQDTETTFGFESETFAQDFLFEEECFLFSKLSEFNLDLNIPPGLIVEPPDWADVEANKFEYLGEDL